MSPEIDLILSEASASMEKAMEHLSNELGKIRAGKASPQMLEGVYVDYYGAATPLGQVANVSSPDARTLVIQPWEKSMLGAIEKGITNANLGLNPQNDGNIVRLNIPPLTEERRKQLVKMSKDETENAKVSVRNIRKEANESIRKQVKDGTPEDDGKVAETKVQEYTDKYVARTDEILKMKEKEILTV